MSLSRTAFLPLRRTALTAALCLGAHANPAASQTIKGTVMDRETGRPLPLARAVLVDARGDSVQVRLAGDDGTFTLHWEEPGDFLLITSAMGYRTSRAGVFELGPGGEIRIQVPLRPEPLEIEGLAVRGEARVPKLVASGFVERMEAGLGRFLTPRDIERGRGSLIVDRLRRVPGVQVRGDQVYLLRKGRRCIPPLFVDGHRAWGSDGEPDVLLRVKDVEAVEIYIGVNETPFRWLGAVVSMSADAGQVVEELCGALVIWTKRRG